MPPDHRPGAPSHRLGWCICPRRRASYPCHRSAAGRTAQKKPREREARPMPIAEQITSYTSWVAQTSYLDYTRVITMRLESGTTVYIGFPQDRPADWLQFPLPGAVILYMTADQYDDVH